jgi:tetratricopeptide (TPR) repeat protein
MLAAEEDNLRAALTLSQTDGWCDGFSVGAVRGLFLLYCETNRRGAALSLIHSVLSDVTDPANETPLPGREYEWMAIVMFRAKLASHNRNWSEAIRLERLLVTHQIQTVSGLLALPTSQWDEQQRNAVRAFAGGLMHLGVCLIEVDQENGFAELQQALNLFERLDLRQRQAICAYNLGIAYMHQTMQKDPDVAEGWFKRCLELLRDDDDLFRARTLIWLGIIATGRFDADVQVNRRMNGQTGHLEDASQAFYKALELNLTIWDRAIVHNRLGHLYSRISAVDAAMEHYQKAISYNLQANNKHGAGITLRNVAGMLGLADRLPDARVYAQAALETFRAVPNAAAEVVEAEALLDEIDQLIAAAAGAV